MTESGRAVPERPIVLSVEQALSMSYATLRFVQLGWRVIRVEATPQPGARFRGDPNRRIGRLVPGAGEERHSYFVGPNVGKEAIALNLKAPEGRALLNRLVSELPVDVVCTNTLPAHHAALGLDYESLRKARREIIWASISAMGLAYPDVPGYDPVLQALCGYMDLTGHAEGPPLQSGPPLTDLRAGDEVFAQVLFGLLERTRTGEGRAIDVSMLQVAATWLQTFLPLLDMGSPPSELRRAGNEHRQFIPTNAYPTADGFVFLAIGSDLQWRRLVSEPLFLSLAEPALETNEGRRAEKTRLHERIAELTRGHSTAEVSAALSRATVAHAPITPIERVMELPALREQLLRTRAPGGQEIRLPPPAVETEFLRARGRELDFAPGFGEHTDAVLGELGLEAAEILRLRERAIIA